MLNFGGEKMSKSLGNVVTSAVRDRDARPRVGCASFSLACTIAARPPSASRATTRASRCTPNLDEAEARLDYFYRTLERLDAFVGTLAAPPTPPPSDLATRFVEAMDDDFNTAAGIGHLYDAFVLANKLLDDAKAAPKAERQSTLTALARDARMVGRDARGSCGGRRLKF